MPPSVVAQVSKLHIQSSQILMYLAVLIEMRAFGVEGESCNHGSGESSGSWKSASFCELNFQKKEKLPDAKEMVIKLAEVSLEPLLVGSISMTIYRYYCIIKHVTIDCTCSWIYF